MKKASERGFKKKGINTYLGWAPAVTFWGGAREQLPT